MFIKKFKLSNKRNNNNIKRKQKASIKLSKNFVRNGYMI